MRRLRALGLLIVARAAFFSGRAEPGLIRRLEPARAAALENRVDATASR